MFPRRSSCWRATPCFEVGSDALTYGGGDFDAIEQSIKERLYTLDGDTHVVAGHGADTNIGQERETNSFVRAHS